MIYYGLEWHSLETYFQLKTTDAPDTPQTGELRVYAKDKSGTAALYLKDDAGNEREIGPAGAITGTGTANRMAYWTSASVIAANAALTSTRIPFADANGLLADSARMVWDNTNFSVTVKSDASVLRGFITEHYQSGGQGPLILGRAASGSFASPGATAADQVLLDINGQGYSGGFTGGRALIRFAAGQVFTAVNQGSYMGFYTTPLNSTTIAERFRIGPSGQWGIGGATYGSSGDIFSSGGASAAPSWVSRATLNAALDHGTVGGLTDDDHTIYALLAGRSGGQTLIGGTASGNGLTLTSTSHSTKGTITLGAEMRVIGSVGRVVLCEGNPTLGAGEYAAGIVPTITSANATAVGLAIFPTFNGAGEGPWGASTRPVFTPSASISTAYGSLNRAFASNLGAGITISTLIGAYYDTIYSSTNGTVTTGYSLYVQGPDHGGSTLKPTNHYGVAIFSQGGAGTISQAVALYIAAQGGATNSYIMELPADATDPTGGGGAATGRIKCLIGGVTRYIPYY